MWGRIAAGFGRYARAAALAALIATAGVGTLAAQERASGWVGQITPYVWATGAGGTIRPFEGAPTIGMDKSFSDLLQDLDAALFLTGLARRDRLVLFGDLTYASLSRSGRVSTPLGDVSASGRLRQTSATLAAGWRLMDEPGVTFDLLGGARAWQLRSSIDLAGVVSRSPRREFVDPIVAGRVNVLLSPRWRALLYADVGGFGVGSELTAQAALTASFALREDVFLSAGYRHLEVDYRSGGTRVDMRLSGPLLGATWRF